MFYQDSLDHLNDLCSKGGLITRYDVAVRWQRGSREYALRFLGSDRLVEAQADEAEDLLWVNGDEIVAHIKIAERAAWNAKYIWRQR